MTTQIVPDEGGVEVIESEFNAAFILHMLPKLEWAAFRDTIREVCVYPGVGSAR